MYMPEVMELKSRSFQETNFREPVPFPDAKEGEEKHKYTLGIKHDEPNAPEWFHVSAGGIVFGFAKKILPSEATDVGNERKHYDSGYPLVYLTTTQAKALWDICGKREYQQRTRQNHDYTGKDDQPEYLKAETLNAQRFVVIKQVKELDPYETPEFERVEEIDTPIDEGEKFQKAVYESQGKNTKRNK